MHPFLGFEQQSNGIQHVEGIDTNVSHLNGAGYSSHCSGSPRPNSYFSSWNRCPSEVRMNSSVNGFSQNPSAGSSPLISGARPRVGVHQGQWSGGSSIPATNHGLPVSKNFVQPHIAQYNVGTSGFVSPTVAAAGVGTLPQTHTSSQIRASFSYGSSGATYQFPSPSPAYAWSGLCSDTETMSSLSAVQVTSERRPTLPLLSSDDSSRNPCGTSMLWAQNSLWSGSEIPLMTTEGVSPTLASASGMHKGAGKVTKQTFASYARNKLHSKRKVLYKDESGPPPKVFIDEERMSARLQELNLDNNNLGWHPDLEEQPWFSQRVNNNNNEAFMDDNDLAKSEPEVEDIEDCGRIPNKQSLPTLELSQEIKLSVNTKDLLPKAILDEMVKPQMQIVLWKPPGDFVKEAVKPESGSSTADHVQHAGLNTAAPKLDDSADAMGMEMYSEAEKMASLSLASPLAFGVTSPGSVPDPTMQTEGVDDSMDL